MTSQRISAEDLDNRFDYHKPNKDRKTDHECIRDVLASAAEYIVGTCPPGRETSTAITKLEEAMFWANAAIARAPQE